MYLLIKVLGFEATAGGETIDLQGPQAGPLTENYSQTNFKKCDLRVIITHLHKTQLFHCWVWQHILSLHFQNYSFALLIFSPLFP